MVSIYRSSWSCRCVRQTGKHREKWRLRGRKGRRTQSERRERLFMGSPFKGHKKLPLESVILWPDCLFLTFLRYLRNLKSCSLILLSVSLCLESSNNYISPCEWSSLGKERDLFSSFFFFPYFSSPITNDDTFFSLFLYILVPETAYLLTNPDTHTFKHVPL